jgi:hypothetical protein
MLKHLQVSDSKLLFRLSLIGLLFYKAFTYKLWIVSDRIFPIVSISDSFRITNVYYHNILSLLSFIAIAILLFRVQKIILFILIISEFLLLATDVMRWQPTVYQYFLTFIVYLIAPKKLKSYLLLLLAATYIYSGLLKFNLRFINFHWAGTILIEFLEISAEYANDKYFKALGFIIPFIETISGILLLTRHKRKGFFLAICTHVFILIFIGKLSFTYSFAIWSWNVIMLLYATIYLSKPNIPPLKLNVLSAVWMILIFVMPSLNFIEKYYPYFSFDMYTGDKHYLYINTPLRKNDIVSTYASVKNDYYLSELVSKLSMKELGVPVTHDKWLYGRFIESFELKFPEYSPCYEIKYYPFQTYEIFEYKNTNQ